MLDRWPVLLFCLSVLFLTHFYKLGNLPFVGADEPRYARVAEEMLLSHDYVTPTLRGEAWLEKPPLLFWMEAASFRLFGSAEWSARFPSAIASALSILFAAFFACRVRTSRSGVLAFLVLATAPLYFVYARAASTDMPLSASYAAAMMSAFLASREQNICWGALAGIVLGVAVLAKGPVALLLFLGTFLIFAVLRQRYLWTFAQTLIATVCFAVTAVPWYVAVWQQNGYDFVATFWLNHHLARFLTNIHHHSQPVWYYLAVLIVGLFPWIFFLGSSLFRQWKTRLSIKDHPVDLFLWIWILVPLVFFSMSQSKLPGYILLIFPALSLLVAFEWDRLLFGDVTVFRLMKVQLAAAVSFALLVCLTLFLGMHRNYRSGDLGLLLALPVGASALWGLFEYRRRRPGRLFLSLVAGMTLFAAIAYWRAAEVVGSYHSARQLALQAKPHLSPDHPLILYRYFHHTASYYTESLTTRESIPSLEALRAFLEAHPAPSYYVLTQKEGWDELEHAFDVQVVAFKGNLFLVKVPGFPAGHAGR